MSFVGSRPEGPRALLPDAIWPPYERGDVAAVLVSAFCALEIGLAVSLKPSVALLPAIALCGILLLVDARARILFLVIGGLLTLQSSDSFGRFKLLYLLGVFVSLGGALFRFSRSGDWYRRRAAMPLLRVSVAMSAMILVSLFVSQQHGIVRTDWLRDAAPYLLFALAPVFALDAQTAFSRKALVRVLVVSGSVATVAFATRWLEQRQIAQLPFSRFALSSFFFPAALFVFAIVTALHQRERRIRWVALAAVVFALLIVTGTRSTLILALGPIIGVIGARRHMSERFVRLALVGPLALLLMLGVAYSVVAATHASTTIISNRISVLKHSGTSSDGSYLDRQAQTRAAQEIFVAHPILGSGPGTYFDWTAQNRQKVSSFLIDSPMAYPAKFGAVGLVVLLFLVLEYGSFFRSAFRFDHPRPETLALGAYAVLAVLGSLLGNPLEDKGLTLGLVLLLALVFRTWLPTAEPTRSPSA